MAAGGGDDLKLLGMWASPYVLRVKLALALKGIDYEYVEVDLKNKSELLLTSNPVHQKVPVLIHNGKPICESQIIVQYLDDAFPDAGAPLLPSDPHDRALARFWAAFNDETLVKASNQASWGKTEEEKAEGEKKVLEALEKMEIGMRECSKGKPFFGGDDVGFVDVMLGGFLAWVRATDAMRGVKRFDPDATPLLAAWAERFVELDVAKALMPEVDKLIEFAKVLQARAAASA
uniref:Glutathione S-transferase n=1 Tax=Leersia perrieri TaxID=77586 RepID=A0A0D9XLS3_9ORYZ